jgi:hypothetical protein
MTECSVKEVLLGMTDLVTRVEMCPSCNRPFYVSEILIQARPEARPEMLECPNCRRSWGNEPSSGFFHTAALGHQQEQDYLKSYRKRPLDLKSEIPARLFRGNVKKA